MLETPVPPTSYSLRVRSKSSGHSFHQEDNQNLYAHTPADPMADMFNDDDDGDLGSHGGGSGKSRSKSRRELPAGAVSTLKAWLLSPEHFTHPYPTPQDQAMLMQKTGIDKKQLKNWFTNARRRIWKPMLKKQIEQGKLSATGAPGVPGAGIMLPAMPPAANGGMDNPHSIQAMRTHYQQAQQQVRYRYALRAISHGRLARCTFMRKRLFFLLIFAKHGSRCLFFLYHRLSMLTATLYMSRQVTRVSTLSRSRSSSSSI